MATELRQRVRGRDKQQKVARAQAGEVNGDGGLSGFHKSDEGFLSLSYPRINREPTEGFH